MTREKKFTRSVRTMLISKSHTIEARDTEERERVTFGENNNRNKNEKQTKNEKKKKNISLIFFIFFPVGFFIDVCSGGSSLFGHPTAVAALFVHRFRHPLPDYAHHQRVPLFGHDLLLFQNRSHREGTQHHRGVWPLPLMARIAIRITVKENKMKKNRPPGGVD